MVKFNSTSQFENAKQNQDYFKKNALFFISFVYSINSVVFVKNIYFKY